MTLVMTFCSGVEDHGHRQVKISDFHCSIDCLEVKNCNFGSLLKSITTIDDDFQRKQFLKFHYFSQPCPRPPVSLYTRPDTTSDLTGLHFL